MSKPLCFVTGNAHKLAEFTSAFRGTVPFVSQAFDVDEIQGSPEEVARAKCRAACALYGGPVLTEDVSLCFKCFNYELPGAYVKHFLTAIGFEGLYRMTLPFDDKAAYAQCIYAYCAAPGEEPLLFAGRCQGRIVEPRGAGNFGKAAFDTIFMADCNGKRFSEMAMDEKNAVSHRGAAVKRLAEFFRAQQAPPRE